jgi:hypothetical protein
MCPDDKKIFTPEQFVIRAIETLRVQPYKGIHSVYSGFNVAFREYFPGLDPVEVTTELARAGRLAIRPARGGVILYKIDDVPDSLSPQDVLKKMGLC